METQTNEEEPKTKVYVQNPQNGMKLRNQSFRQKNILCTVLELKTTKQGQPPKLVWVIERFFCVWHIRYKLHHFCLVRVFAIRCPGVTAKKIKSDRSQRSTYFRFMQVRRKVKMRFPHRFLDKASTRWHKYGQCWPVFRRRRTDQARNKNCRITRLVTLHWRATLNLNPNFWDK